MRWTPRGQMGVGFNFFLHKGPKMSLEPHNWPSGGGCGGAPPGWVGRWGVCNHLVEWFLVWRGWGRTHFEQWYPPGVLQGLSECIAQAHSQLGRLTTCEEWMKVTMMTVLGVKFRPLGFGPLEIASQVFLVAKKHKILQLFV